MNGIATLLLESHQCTAVLAVRRMHTSRMAATVALDDLQIKSRHYHQRVHDSCDVLTAHRQRHGQFSRDESLESR
jgi:hypothetical protein